MRKPVIAREADDLVPHLRLPGGHGAFERRRRERNVGADDLVVHVRLRGAGRVALVLAQEHLAHGGIGIDPTGDLDVGGEQRLELLERQQSGVEQIVVPLRVVGEVPWILDDDVRFVLTARAALGDPRNEVAHRADQPAVVAYARERHRDRGPAAPLPGCGLRCPDRTGRSVARLRARRAGGPRARRGPQGRRAAARPAPAARSRRASCARG